MEIEQQLPLQFDSDEINKQQSNHIIMSYRWIRLLLISATVKSILGLFILLLLFVFSLIVFLTGLHFHNFHSCPIEPKTSLFLVVAGILSIQWIILSVILSIISIVQKHFRSLLLISFNIAIALIIIIMNIFLAIWQIFGSMWTLKVLDKVQYIDPHRNTFCELTLYRFTLGYLFINYILSGLQFWYRVCTVIFCTVQQQ